MGKKKNNTTTVNNIQNMNMEIDYDKLAEAIVRSKKIEEENEAKQKAEAFTEWQKNIGVKSHNDKKGIIKKLYVFCNTIKVFFHLIFYPKKRILQVSMTGIFMQSMTAMFFNLVKYLLWILSFAFICLVFFHGNMDFRVLDYVYYIGFALIAFVLAGIFRLMAIEIEQTSDRERILGVFTAVISVIPMIEIIIEFFKEVI